MNKLNQVTLWQTVLLENQDGKVIFVPCPAMSLMDVVDAVIETNHPGVITNGVSDNEAEIIQIIFTKPKQLVILKPILLKMSDVNQDQPLHQVNLKLPKPDIWKFDPGLLIEVARINFEIWLEWSRSRNN